MDTLTDYLMLAAYVADSNVTQQGSYNLLVIYALVALGFSFFCSIAEAVLLSVTPSYIAAPGSQTKGIGTDDRTTYPHSFPSDNRPISHPSTPVQNALGSD